MNRAAALLAIALPAAIVALGECLGWPFLAVPAQRLLAEALDRPVQMATAADPGAAGAQGFGIRLLGGLRLHAPGLEIGAPAWSQAPYLMRAREVTIELRYVDLWRAHRGQPVRIERLRAASLDGHLERLADGRASWQFGPEQPPTAQPVPIPTFGSLQVASGTLHFSDVPLAIDAVIDLSLADGASQPAVPAADGSLNGPALDRPKSELRVHASGYYRNFPLQAELLSSGVMPWAADEALAGPVPVTMHATVGRASLAFKGSAVDALHLQGLSGRFSMQGPSLAAVGDPVGVTLPTTHAFRADGAIVKRGDTWLAVVDDAMVGASHVGGAFTYETARSVPLLAGRIVASRLLLADLGPVVGATPLAAASAPASAPAAQPSRGRGKVLPDRPFDLAALRVMDANVLIDVRELDLDTRLLAPLRPLRGHLLLQGGVLTLRDLDAGMGEGRFKGELRLDGRAAVAKWNADLRWDGIRLERWIHQARAAGLPPYVSGRLSGRATLQGQGHSTADILGSLKGDVRTELHDGAVSHLAIEVAGMDLAQALGMLLKGDDALPVRCGVASLVVAGGVLRPRVMVIDTTDSAVWVDGSLSLADESLDLRAVVMPKDFSPLALRTPLHVRGNFAHPELSLETGPLSLKVAAAIALAFVNPLAALIPLIDPGNPDAARQGASGCVGLTQHGKPGRSAATPVR